MSAQLASTTISNGSGNPAGACTSGSEYVDSATGNKWTCTASAWGRVPITSVGSAGLSGTVPVTIAATGAIACATCVTSAAALTNNSPVLGGALQASKTATFLTTDGAATLTVGIAGGGNGVLALGGNTSGTATRTAPAVAGTRSNPVVESNNLQVPGLNVTNLLLSSTAPTIAGAGCGGSGATIASNNGTADFTINTGTAPTSGGCTVTMPAAATAWDCSVNDITTTSATVFLQKKTGGSTTSVILQNFSTTPAAAAPVASDVWEVRCTAR